MVSHSGESTSDHMDLMARRTTNPTSRKSTQLASGIAACTPQCEQQGCQPSLSLVLSPSLQEMLGAEAFAMHTLVEGPEVWERKVPRCVRTPRSPLGAFTIAR